jgi:hypothetical protein
MAQKKQAQGDKFFVRAGHRRKQRVANALRIVEQTEADFVRAAVDEKLDRLAKKHPKINKV